jgi:hypothetical protein
MINKMVKLHGKGFEQDNTPRTGNLLWDRQWPDPGLVNMKRIIQPGTGYKDISISLNDTT